MLVEKVSLGEAVAIVLLVPKVIQDVSRIIPGGSIIGALAVALANAAGAAVSTTMMAAITATAIFLLKLEATPCITLFASSLESRARQSRRVEQRHHASNHRLAGASHDGGHARAVRTSRTSKTSSTTSASS